VYIESRIIASAFPLNAYGEYGKIGSKQKSPKENE